MYAIETKHIYKVFKESGRKHIEALKDISIDAREGEFFVLLGPSGSGKSTLLRVMSQLVEPSSGSVAFGAGLSKRDIGFVFQQFALLPWLTIAENVGMNLLGRKVPTDERVTRVHAALEEFGLAKFAHSYPRELSGGMRQRVGLARAFVTEPKIIFLDEPFSELDFFTAAELRKELLTLWEKTHATIVMVSHNITEALELADRIAVLSVHPGAVKDIIVNELPRPRHARSQEFFAMEDKLTTLLTQPVHP